MASKLRELRSCMPLGSREPKMPIIITDEFQLTIPEWVTDLAAFRRWTDEQKFPPRADFWWLRGRVWADLSTAQIESHNQVRGAIILPMIGLIEQTDLGDYLDRGIYLVNAKAGFCGKPDGMFLAYPSLAEGRYHLAGPNGDGFTEIDGSPDMVLEIVGNSSEEKDTAT